MKKFLNKIKNKLNDINTQLTLGISSIVFISTFIIAIIFISQYRTLSLVQAEQSLEQQAIQLSNAAKSILSPNDDRPHQIFWSSLREMTNTDLWIIDANGNLILSTNNETGKIDIKQLANIKTTYIFSEHFETKTMTTVSKVVEDGQTLGFIMLHKDVNVIYSSYNTFRTLIFASLIISLIISTTLGIAYSSYFTKPIEIITKVADEIRKRNYKVQTGIVREDQIGNLAKTFDQMSVEINKNIDEITELELRAKELVANVSHEFKTPLTLIRGYSMNLKDKTIKPSDEVYNKIINNTITLEKLVNDLLDLGKYQSGKITLNKEHLDAYQLLSDVVGDMKSLANNKNIKLEIINKNKKELILNADYTKMRQLFTIFIDNAIKYSNENTLIKVMLKDSEIQIIDQGIGIAKNDLEQIFNRYYRIKEDEKGYGLGLCIAKYIADAHNYELEIKSIKNKGTTVKIIV